MSAVGGANGSTCTITAANIEIDFGETTLSVTLNQVGGNVITKEFTITVGWPEITGIQPGGDLVVGQGVTFSAITNPANLPPGYSFIWSYNSEGGAMNLFPATGAAIPLMPGSVEVIVQLLYDSDPIGVSFSRPYTIIP